MGLEKVVSELEWYGSAEFNEESALNFLPWTFKNVTNGQTLNGGGMLYSDYMTFLKIKGTGMRVHREKPELMIDLLKQWIGNYYGQLNKP